jgi:hypothetical protein
VWVQSSAKEERHNICKMATGEIYQFLKLSGWKCSYTDWGVVTSRSDRRCAPMDILRGSKCFCYLAVLRIFDILVWIRIRILGSMPLTNGSGSFYFHHWHSRWQQKTN